MYVGVSVKLAVLERVEDKMTKTRGWRDGGGG